MASCFTWRRSRLCLTSAAHNLQDNAVSHRPYTMRMGTTEIRNSTLAGHELEGRLAQPSRCSSHKLGRLDSSWIMGSCTGTWGTAYCRWERLVSSASLLTTPACSTLPRCRPNLVLMCMYLSSLCIALLPAGAYILLQLRCLPPRVLPTLGPALPLQLRRLLRPTAIHQRRRIHRHRLQPPTGREHAPAPLLIPLSRVEPRQPSRRRFRPLTRCSARQTGSAFGG